MLEVAEMVPAAELDRAGEPLLIVLVGALDHQQRRIVELEIEPVLLQTCGSSLAQGGAGSPL